MNPNSPGAHLNLAHLIRSAVNAGCPGIWDYGCAYGEGPTTDLIPEALAAYRRALELTPNDADLYAEYLEFLISTTGYVEEIANELFPKLEYALTLDPDNERLITICSGLEEIGFWPPVTAGLTLSPTVEQVLGATGAPTYNQTPTPPRASDLMGSMSTEPALVTPIASSSGGRVLAWLAVILILGLLFIGIAGAIIIVARRK